MRAMIIRSVLDPSLPLADLFPHSPGPYIALMLAGFAIGILGHVFRATWLVIAGIALIFLGALLFPAGGEPDDREPRRRRGRTNR